MMSPVTGIKHPLIRYSLVGFFGLAFFYTWFATATGLRLTLYGLCYFSDCLTIEGVCGCLAGPARIGRLSYKRGNYQWTVTDLCIHWKKIAILQGKFHIKHLSLKSLVVISREEKGQVPDLSRLRWLGIEQINIQACQIQTNHWHLSASGAIGFNKALEWHWAGYGLEWAGKLQAIEGNNFGVQLLAQCVPAADYKHLSATQTTANYEEAKKAGGSPLTSKDQPLNYISIKRSTIASSRFFGNSQTEWQLNGRLEDARILQYIGLTSLEHTSGKNRPLILDCRFNSTFKRLISYLQAPKPYSLSKYFCYHPGINFRASIDWETSPLLPWGAFNRFTMQGKLHPSRLLWEGYFNIKDKQPGKEVAYWKIIGDTQLSLGKRTIDPQSSLASYLHMVTELRLKGDAATFFANTDYELSAAPLIKARINNRYIQLSGKVEIPHACFKLPTFKPEISPDPDIEFISKESHLLNTATWPWDIQIDLKLGKAVYLYAAGLNARLAGSLSIGKQHKESATAQGEIKMAEGDYYFGQRLQLNPESRLIFTNQLDDPQLDIAAGRLIEPRLRRELFSVNSAARLDTGCTTTKATDGNFPLCSSVGIYLRGNLQNPILHLLLKPEGRVIDEMDGLSYLVTNHSLDSFAEKTLPLLLNATAQFAKTYFNEAGLCSRLYKKSGIAMNIESQALSQNTSLIVSKRLTSQLAILGKIGLIESDYPVGFHYAIGKHAIIGASLEATRKIGAFEMAYQREWD